MISEFYSAVESTIERRTFLKIGSISMTGLVLGLNRLAMVDKAEVFAPNVFVAIDKNGGVKLVVHRSEMGQGIRSSMAGILADELEVDWSKVEVVQADGDRKFGDQNTDGSKSIRDFYLPMRRMGAAARQMLEQAAAKQWSVSTDRVKAENGKIILKEGDKSVAYGDLVDAAAAEAVPSSNAIKLKARGDLKHIGKKMPSVDVDNVVNGKAGYGIDQKIAGMKYAVIARCPVYGGKVKSFDDSETLKVKGVERTIKLDYSGLPSGFDRVLGGVAVVASNTWAAIKGREKLKIEWDEGANGQYDAEKAQEDMLAGFSKPAFQVKVGEVNDDEINLEANYFIPHYTHSPMEPPVALADVKESSCEVWAPSQSPQWARGTVAQAIGMNPANVKMSVTLLGGGFGRKAKPDFVAEAAIVSKACGNPVKLMWTREDDIRHGFYHAQSVQQVRATINSDNEVVSWNHRSAFPSISGTANLGARSMQPPERGQGLEDMPYDIPNMRIEVGEAAPAGVRIGWMRSVANINHAFAIGSFMDEIAEARKMDPKENLLDLLGEDRVVDFSKRSPNLWYYGENQQQYPWDTSRFRAVIERVASESGWGKRLANGQGMGIAAHRSFLTYVACVARVEVQSNGRVRIPVVHYAVDCGVAVNPDRIKAQFEGGAVFGTNLALYSRLDVKGGKVSQDNFHNYKIARMAEAPQEVHVHLIESDQLPTGVGEPPVPPVAPAICNAIFAATGKRIRRLPVDKV